MFVLIEMIEMVLPRPPVETDVEADEDHERLVDIELAGNDRASHRPSRLAR